MVNLPVSKHPQIKLVQNCHQATVSVVSKMRICTVSYQGGEIYDS